MGGLTETILPAAGQPWPIEVKSQWYDTALRKVRQYYGPEWPAVLARTTKHYKSGMGLRIGATSDLVAWLHCLDASPWVLPVPETEGLVLAAYSADYVAKGVPNVTVGAAGLSEDPCLRVVKLDSMARVRHWLQRVGPCVVEGYWTPSMFEVKRDTEVIGPRHDIGPGPAHMHAVALVGFRPDGVRLVNNQGVGWGALGRAWMPWETLDDLIEGDGVGWGVIPDELHAKRGAK